MNFLIKLNLRKITFRFWWWLLILPSLLAFLLIFGIHKSLESQLGGDLREGMPIYISNISALDELRQVLDLDLSFTLVELPEDSVLLAMEEGQLEAVILAEKIENSPENIRLEIYVDSYVYGDTWERLQEHLSYFENEQLGQRLSILGMKPSDINPIQTDVVDFGQAKQLDIIGQIPMITNISLGLLFLGLLGRSIYFFSIQYEKQGLGNTKYSVSILTFLGSLQFIIFWLALLFTIHNLPSNSLLKPFMVKVFSWANLFPVVLLTISLVFFVVVVYQFVIRRLSSIEAFRQGLFIFWLLYIGLSILMIRSSVEIAYWEAFLPIWAYLRGVSYLLSSENIWSYYLIVVVVHLGSGSLLMLMNKPNLSQREPTNIA